MSSHTAVIDRTQVKNAARRFAEAIAGTPAIGEYGAAVDAVRADEAALHLLQQLQDARRALQMSADWNNDASTERQRLQQLEAEVEQNAALQRLFASQKAMIDQLQIINAQLREPLGFDFAALARPACSCG
ncbi:MAG: YlbF family regulator [Spirochaetaceae bacterium]|nr:MAG: YlbF family regulator [Spirochaetaceae bacterium]